MPPLLAGSHPEPSSAGSSWLGFRKPYRAARREAFGQAVARLHQACHHKYSPLTNKPRRACVTACVIASLRHRAAPRGTRLPVVIELRQRFPPSQKSSWEFAPACPRGIRISGVSRRSSPISVGRRQTCPRTLEGAPGILSPLGMLETGTDPDDQIPVCQRAAHQPSRFKRAPYRAR